MRGLKVGNLPLFDRHRCLPYGTVFGPVMSVTGTASPEALQNQVVRNPFTYAHQSENRLCQFSCMNQTAVASTPINKNLLEEL